MVAKIAVEMPFRVIDLKQWVYCPRILYFHHCLPRIRPTTYKMKAGTEAGQNEEGREMRRSLRAYGLRAGRRAFNLPLNSERYGLRGKADMVIFREEEPEEIIPVDYKLSKKAGKHFKLQLLAYGLMLEDEYGVPATRGFLYFIPERKAQEVRFTPRLRKNFLDILDNMLGMLHSEKMPEPSKNRRKCVSCEFRRFCNDVL